MLDSALCKRYLMCAVRGKDNRLRVFLSPAPLFFSTGRPVLGVKRPPFFWIVCGSDRRLGRSISLITAGAWASLRLIPCPLNARRHFARRPSAASAAGDGGGALRSSPARSARSAFAVQLRPTFADAPASGIFHHRPIRAACDTQRLARRLGVGPAVMPRVRGAFTAFGKVLVCASPTIANQRLRSIKTQYSQYSQYS